jgi:hypothetical protein
METQPAAGRDREIVSEMADLRAIALMNVGTSPDIDLTGIVQRIAPDAVDVARIPVSAFNSCI